MSTITMFDSIFPAQLPKGAAAYAGYVGGRWPTFTTLLAMFPDAHLLSIAIAASEDAQCLDVETGDATIAQVYGWFTRQKSRGVWRPVIYTSAGETAALLATMKANGIARSAWRLWSAHYGLGEHICGPTVCGYPQADGTQWTSTALGRSLDQSLLAGDFFATKPKPDPKPAPKPAPALPEDETMIEFDTTRSHTLLPPFGTPTIDLLTTAPDAAPLKVTVTWMDQGGKATGQKLSWGSADSEPGITVPKGVKKGRIDIVSGGGPDVMLGVRFDPPAS